MMPFLLKYFNERIQTFYAGNRAFHNLQWQALTSDAEILETVSGEKVEFQILIPVRKGIKVMLTSQRLNFC